MRSGSLSKRLSALPRTVVCVCAAFSLAVLTPWRASAHADKRAEGAALFASNGCTHCHGANGEGTERGPALRDVRKRLKPEAIAHQIGAGGGAMPAFGEILSPAQIESLVTFLRAKTWAAAPPATPASEPPAQALP